MPSSTHFRGKKGEWTRIELWPIPEPNSCLKTQKEGTSCNISLPPDPLPTWWLGFKNQLSHFNSKCHFNAPGVHELLKQVEWGRVFHSHLCHCPSPHPNVMNWIPQINALINKKPLLSVLNWLLTWVGLPFTCLSDCSSVVGLLCVECWGRYRYIIWGDKYEQMSWLSRMWKMLPVYAQWSSLWFPGPAICSKNPYNGDSDIVPCLQSGIWYMICLSGVYIYLLID